MLQENLVRDQGKKKVYVNAVKFRRCHLGVGSLLELIGFQG